MDLKVAIPWWTPRSVGGSQQAIRGNVKGFLEIGADVDLYLLSGWEDALPLGDRADEYDLVLWPFIRQWIDTEPDEAHVHATIGGFGPSETGEDQIRAMFKRADSISFLDPLLAEHYQDRVGLPLAASRMLLNPPNRELFDAEDFQDDWVLECRACGGVVDNYLTEAQAAAAAGGHKTHHGHDHTARARPRYFLDGGDGHVLTPKIGNEHKTGEWLGAVAQRTPDALYEVSVVQAIGPGPVNPGPELPANVRVVPGVPYTAMPARYAEASVVFNVAEREAGPNVAYEAFLADRPFVTTPNGLGYHKRLPAVAVDVDHIGTSMDWWFDDVGAYVGAGRGEHYATGDDPEALATTIETLLDSPARRADLVRGASTWLEQLDGYDWAAKARAIVEIMEET